MDTRSAFFGEDFSGFIPGRISDSLRAHTLRKTLEPDQQAVGADGDDRRRGSWSSRSWGLSLCGGFMGKSPIWKCFLKALFENAPSCKNPSSRWFLSFASQYYANTTSGILNRIVSTWKPPPPEQRRPRFPSGTVSSGLCSPFPTLSWNKVINNKNDFQMALSVGVRGEVGGARTDIDS